MYDFIKTKDVKFLCKYYFGETLTPKQELIVRSIAFKESERIVISCLTRYGKSFCVAMGVLLYIRFNPNKKVGLIAPIREQTSILRNYIAEFAMRHNEFIDLIEMEASWTQRIKREISRSRITFRNGVSLQVLSAEGKATRLMGWGFDLIILDESCLINPEVYKEKISRMLGDSKDSMLVEIGNPWTKDSHMYSHWEDPVFHKIHVDWKDAVKEGRVTEVFVEEQRRILSDNQFKVLYEADFPETSEDSLFRPEWIDNSLDLKLSEKKKFDIVYGVDVAEAGNDLTVLTKARFWENKYKVFEVHSWHKADTMETAGLVAKHAKKDKPAMINVDAIGVGKGVADRLQELDFEVCAVKVGCAATKNKDRFLNLKAQYYWRLRTLFEDGMVSLSFKNNVNFLVRELKAMRYELTSNSKVRVVDPEMKSPDFADSLMLCCCGGGSEFVYLDDVADLFNQE